MAENIMTNKPDFGDNYTPKKIETINQKIDGIMLGIESGVGAALPAHVNPERIKRVIKTSIKLNPALANASAQSLVGSIMTAAQLGLEPNTPLGHCYLIVYKNDVQFQLGYRGILELSYRSGNFKDIASYSVDKADEFSYKYGLEPDLQHVPALEPTGDITHYYAVYKLVNGGNNFKVWTRSAVLKHAINYSKSWDKNTEKFRPGSAWDTSFDSMAQKTVIIDALKYAPKSIELQNAIAGDNQAHYWDQNDRTINVHTQEGED